MASRMTIPLALTGIIVAPVAAILLATPAHADPGDFITDLTSYGFTVTPDMQSTIVKMGQAVCLTEAGGTSHAETVQQVYDSAPEGTINLHQAGNFVTAAETDLC